MGEQKLRNWQNTATAGDLSMRRVVELQRGSSSVSSQAELELRRAARARYGDSAVRQATQTRQTVSRLVSNAPTKKDSVPVDDVVGKVIKYGGITAGVGVVGSGMAIAGAVDVLLFALQPVFLATAILAGFSTYLTGAFLDRSRSTTQMFVDGIEDEPHGLVSVHVQYENEEPPVAPGQLAMWRFVSPGMRSYPVEGYLTSLPEGGAFRLMFALDEESADALRLVPEGTKIEFKEVLEDSPEEVTRPALIIAAGAGVAPARGMLESLPDHVSMIYRAPSKDHLMLVDELRGVAQYRGAELHFSVGRSSNFDQGRQPLCPEHLMSVTPDVRHREVFVMGPSAVVRSATRSLQQLGVPAARIHAQVF